MILGQRFRGKQNNRAQRRLWVWQGKCPENDAVPGSAGILPAVAGAPRPRSGELHWSRISCDWSSVRHRGKGRRVAVLIDLKKHGARLEGFWDGLISESRRAEVGIPLEKVKADLVRRGRFVINYAVELKPSARKELESLPNTALTRVIRKDRIPLT